jgi:hypothetical protein
LEAGEAIARRAAPYRAVRLPDSDLVHMDSACTTGLVAHAVDRDGVPVLAVCLASALFDWCIFATGGWEPDAVASYLTRAASLFDRLLG